MFLLIWNTVSSIKHSREPNRHRSKKGFEIRVDGRYPERDREPKVFLTHFIQITISTILNFLTK